MGPLTHLQSLEAESIHILRVAVAESERPVMLYSMGKDSSVMLHLALKAFYPSAPPFPLLHVDTTWKFREMYEFRDTFAQDLGVDLLVYQNPECLAQGINPFTHGSAVHTHMWKTEGLKKALDEYGFDVAFGGARRDEEKSRAKERVFSIRSAQHRWDPKAQRPELWRLFNVRRSPGESIRVFPLSNWTELDIWQYVEEQQLMLPPIYFAHRRTVFRRTGMLLAVGPWTSPRGGVADEQPFEATVRYRTVGDMTCTAAVESIARTPAEVIAETALTRVSERGATRADDRFSEASMEDRKREGYF
jgi:sulfate adenylyltransferase subunit 2